MLKEQSNYSKTGYFLLLAMLFLSAMNFQAKFFYFAFAATAMTFVFFRGSQINGAFIWYLALSFIMSLYNIENGIFVVFRTLSYPMLYYVGYVLSVNSIEKNCTIDCRIKLSRYRAYNIIVTVALGSFVHFMLNFFYNFGENIGRNTNDVWTGTMQAATGQTALACLMTGMAVSLVLVPRKKYSSILGWLSILGILAYNLVLAGRTSIVLLLSAFVVGFYFVNKNTKQFSKKMNLFAWVIFVSVIIFVIWIFDLGEIQKTFEESNLYSRFFSQTSNNIYDSGRNDRKIDFLKDMFNYPFGGLNMRDKYGYAHDLLLDAYDEYGVFCLIILIVILVNGIKNLLLFCKNGGIDLHIRTAYFCVYIVILETFYIEPIFAGASWLFVCYCLINGTVAGNNALEYEKSYIEKRGLT